MSTLLSRGVPTKLVDAADGTGTGFSTEFVISANPGSQKRVQLHAIAVTDPTVFSVDLETSLDGGTTWHLFTNFNFVVLFSYIIELVSGPLYRFNIQSITLDGGNKVHIMGVSG